MHSLFYLKLEFKLLESVLESKLPRVVNVELLAVEVEDATCYMR